MTMNTPKPPPGPPPRRGPRVVVKKADPNAGKAEKVRRQNKIALWSMGLAASAVFVWAGWAMLGGLFRTRPPNLDTASSKEIVAFLTSDKFAKLSEGEKSAFSEGLQSLPDNRRREIYSVQGLSSQDRRKMFENLRSARSGGPGRGPSLQEMKDFFALSPDQQLAKLDERIDEGESRRRDFAARRANPSSDNATGSGRGFRGSGPPGGEGSGGPRAGGTGGTGGPRTGRKAPTEERAQVRTEMRLDNSTPAERAYRSEYFRRMRERQQQRQAAKK